MKLLVCATEYYPHGSGIANVAYNVVQQLERKGVECTICSPTGPDIEVTSTAGGNRLSLIHYWCKVSHLFKRQGDLYDIAWLHYPLFIGPNPFKSSYVTIHSTAHGISYPPYLRPYQSFSKLLEKHCLNKLDEDIPFSSVSEQSILDLRSNGVYRKDIVKIINGVDTSVFAPIHRKEQARAKFGLPSDSIIFLYVGRLTYHKMPYRMLDIFKKIQNLSKEYILVIAGRGELLPDLEAYASRNGVRVRFLGYVESESLPDLYACSNYFFMTSMYEGGEPTLTVAEALASGLPCIMSRLPNFNMVEKHDLGILFHPSNNELAEAQIINYLRSHDQSLSSRIHKFAKENLDWKVITDKYYTGFCNALRQ